MAGEFGAYIAQKRIERDVKLKSMAERLGMSVTYLSDIIKGRRNPPDKAGLDIMAEMLCLSEEERHLLYDLAGKERDQASPDLTEIIMDDSMGEARTALRRASSKNLGNDFWEEVNRMIDARGSNQ